MKAKLINENPNTYAVTFETGEDPVEGLERLAVELGLDTASFTGIGAFSEVTLGYFSLEKKDYKRIPVAEQVDALSLIGDVTLRDGQPQVHAHVVVGRSDATTLGGHLMTARVRPSLELILTESPTHLERTPEAATGQPAIDLK